MKDGDRIALAVTTGGNVPIFDSSVGRAFWRGYRRAQEASKKEQDAVICLSCGMEKPPVLTAEKLMGVPGGQASGTSLLSFDKDSFQSLGWDKNKNAPVCDECSFGYTRGLNHLLLRSNTPRTRVDQGGVAFQFWLDSGSAGNIIDNFFEEPDSQEAEMLLSAARTGRPLGDRPDQRLFALGLRGNGGRAIVTDWFDTTLADAYRNLSRWFDDLSVVLARDETEKGVIYRNTGENPGLLDSGHSAGPPPEQMRKSRRARPRRSSGPPSGAKNYLSPSRNHAFAVCHSMASATSSRPPESDLSVAPLTASVQERRFLCQDLT